MHVDFLITFSWVYVKGHSSCVLPGSRGGETKTDSRAAVLKVVLTLSDIGNAGKHIKENIAGAIRQMPLRPGQ